MISKRASILIGITLDACIGAMIGKRYGWQGGVFAFHVACMLRFISLEIRR